jgi:hypothetical protein
MKTILSFRNFLMIASIVALVSSCKKDEMEGTQVNLSANPSTPAATVIGSITDLGPVATDLRLMMVEINKPGNLYDSGSGDFIASTDKIVMNFYTSSDGLIPDGTYYFSDAGVKQPFTFDSGILSMPVGAYKAGGSGNQISDGYVNVSRHNEDYTFIFSLSLNSGELLSGTSSGNASYQDSSAK